MDSSNPYAVVGNPNYSAAMVNMFGQSGQQQNGQQGQAQQGAKNGQQGMTFAQALQKFLNGGQSTGQPTSLAPPLASSNAPMIAQNGMGFY